LLSVATLQESVGLPAEEVVNELQQERRLSLVYLGNASGGQPAELDKQRAKTDSAAIRFTESAQAAWAADAALTERIDGVVNSLTTLQQTRQNIDARRLDRERAGVALTSIIEATFRIYGSLATLDDPELAKDGRTLITLTRAQEVLAQEDALLAGVLASGRMEPGERTEFARLVSVRRFLLTEAAAELPDTDRAKYEEFVSGAAYTELVSIEDAIVDEGAHQVALSSVADRWAAVRPEVADDLRTIVREGAAGIAERAAPAAIGVIVRLGLAGVLGLIAVIASIVISITTARNLVRQLERLRTAARDLASYRLPRVVERLRHGEKVDVQQEAPPLDFGSDEIGQVGQAFNAVQETAVRVAVEQADLRRSVRDVFLSLARRSQALLHRQLGLLDGMERRATDAEELAELFRIDHLATRMRRNAENLIVLSGATAGRAWRRPVPMVDVLRGALAEVEDYTRVTVLPVGSSALVGRAVGDVIHLLAELIENAVSFSPPQAVVRVGGSIVGNGFAIEIEDRGLGMTEEERAAANEQLRNPPDFNLSSTARLGLYVVGKLAERHGIRVRLTESPYGGTTAIVLLPAALIADEPRGELDRLDAGTLDGAARPSQLANAIVGRHRHDAYSVPELSAARQPDRPDPAQPMLVEPAVVEPAMVEPAMVEPAMVEPAMVEAAVVEATPPSIADADNPSTPSARTGSSARRPDAPILTPSGLPWRQRSGPGRGPGHPAPVTPVAPAHPDPGSITADNSLTAGSAGAAYTRGPEDMRSRMSAFRSGTLRGRSDAARLTDSSHPPGPAETPHEPTANEEEE
jgi:signal transduction histidine kinase